jgi:hypothetical protein
VVTAAKRDDWIVDGHESVSGGTISEYRDGAPERAPTPGLFEVARGRCGLRSRIGGHGGKFVRRGMAFVGEKACGEGASALQELGSRRG